MADINFTCTDDDCYQWQGKRTDLISSESGRPISLYFMCQVSKVGDNYAIAYGSFIPDDYDDDIPDIADFFGYWWMELVRNEDLLAECIFEYFIDDFYENVTQGPIPVYGTAEEACCLLDAWMGESHKDMWLHDTADVRNHAVTYEMEA